MLRESATPCCAVILVVCFLYECLALSFFFLPKLQYHSTEKEESTLEESTTQAERITSGRFSSLKHKGEAKLKANFAAIWAATLQDLRAQTKEQQRKDKAELRIKSWTKLVLEINLTNSSYIFILSMNFEN